MMDPQQTAEELKLVYLPETRIELYYFNRIAALTTLVKQLQARPKHPTKQASQLLNEVNKLKEALGKAEMGILNRDIEITILKSTYAIEYLGVMGNSKQRNTRLNKMIGGMIKTIEDLRNQVKTLNSNYHGISIDK